LGVHNQVGYFAHRAETTAFPGGVERVFFHIAVGVGNGEREAAAGHHGQVNHVVAHKGALLRGDLGFGAELCEGLLFVFHAVQIVVDTELGSAVGEFRAQTIDMTFCQNLKLKAKSRAESKI